MKTPPRQLVHAQGRRSRGTAVPAATSWWQDLRQLLRKVFTSRAGFLFHFLIPNFTNICQNEGSEGHVVDQSLATNSKFSLLATRTQIQISGQGAPSRCRSPGRVFPRAGTVAAHPTAWGGSAAPRSPKIPLPAWRAQGACDAFASRDGGGEVLIPSGIPQGSSPTKSLVPIF